MSIPHCKISASSPAEAAPQLQRSIADIYGQIATDMSADDRCGLIAAYIMSVADWLAALTGPDNAIEALECAAQELRTYAPALKLQRAQAAQGVH